MSLGLIVVPLYTVDRPDNIAYIINDADVKVLLFENNDQWQALRTVLGQLGGVVRFVSIADLQDGDEARLKPMSEFLPATAAVASCAALPDERTGQHHLYLRHHRQTQGRDAEPCQYAHQCACLPGHI